MVVHVAVRSIEPQKICLKIIWKKYLIPYNCELFVITKIYILQHKAAQSAATVQYTDFISADT